MGDAAGDQIKRLTKADREQVFAKFGGRCAYCGAELGRGWHADHVKPIIRASATRAYYAARHALDNIFPACAPCNRDKGGHDLEGWRRSFEAHLRSLNRLSIFRISKAHGVVVETGAPIQFYFERSPHV